MFDKQKFIDALLDLSDTLHKMEEDGQDLPDDVDLFWLQLTKLEQKYRKDI